MYTLRLKQNNKNSSGEYVTCYIDTHFLVFLFLLENSFRKEKNKLATKNPSSQITKMQFFYNDKKSLFLSLAE